MVNSKKLLSLIGLATRARKVVSGEFSTEKSVKSGRSRMVIVSEEASDNTKKMFTNMCAHYKVPIYLFGTKDELGHAMGQEFRASLSVEDAGFAKSMAALMNVNGRLIRQRALFLIRRRQNRRFFAHFLCRMIKFLLFCCPKTKCERTRLLNY